MTNILLYNFGFWFNILIPIFIGIYLYFTHKEYVLKELGLQVVASLTLITCLYMLFFATTTDLFDKEYQNSKVSNFEYYESWTERVEYYEDICSGSGEKRKCRSVKRVRYDYHPPYWQLNTTNNEVVSISQSNYSKALRSFNNENKVYLHRSNQSSFGDGNKYIVNPTEILPTAVGHNYVNYVKEARDNVIHNKFSKEEIEQYLKSGDLKNYPKEYSNDLGVPQIYRVVDTTGLVNINEWTNKLHYVANELGKSKQANPIIYFTQKDLQFADVLEYHWSKGRKNDVILMIGINNKGEFQWTRIIAWTNNTNYLVDGTKFLRDDNFTINNSTEVISKFKELTISGFVRKPMKEFEYLAENITLAWYWQIFIIIINIIVSGYITYYFLNNRERK